MVKNKGNNKGHDNLIPIKKGECLNPNGRPKGQRNYATLYRLAMEKIAVSEGMTVDDFEIKFVQQALRKGFNGDTRLYTDTLDRIHGKAAQSINQNITGQLNITIPAQLAQAFNINAKPNTETGELPTE